MCILPSFPPSLTSCYLIRVPFLPTSGSPLFRAGIEVKPGADVTQAPGDDCDYIHISMVGDRPVESGSGALWPGEHQGRREGGCVGVSAGRDERTVGDLGISKDVNSINAGWGVQRTVWLLFLSPLVPRSVAIPAIIAPHKGRQ